MTFRCCSPALPLEEPSVAVLILGSLSCVDNLPEAVVIGVVVLLQEFYWRNGNVGIKSRIRLTKSALRWNMGAVVGEPMRSYIAQLGALVQKLDKNKSQIWKILEHMLYRRTRCLRALSVKHLCTSEKGTRRSAASHHIG